MSGRAFWAMTAAFATFSFIAGCIHQLRSEEISIDMTGLDPQAEYCAERAEQIYRMGLHEAQIACSIRAREELCPDANEDCQQEAITFCRVAAKLELLRSVDQCLKRTTPAPPHETLI